MGNTNSEGGDPITIFSVALTKAAVVATPLHGQTRVKGRL